MEHSSDYLKYNCNSWNGTHNQTAYIAARLRKRSHCFILTDYRLRNITKSTVFGNNSLLSDSLPNPLFFHVLDFWNRLLLCTFKKKFFPPFLTFWNLLHLCFQCIMVLHLSHHTKENVLKKMQRCYIFIKYKYPCHSRGHDQPRKSGNCKLILQKKQSTIS